MSESKNLQSIVYGWFDKSKNWQKDLFNRLSISDVSIEQLDQLFKLYYDTIKIDSSKLETTRPAINFNRGNNIGVCSFDCLSEVEGVGGIHNVPALEFKSRMNIIYGRNGCGKTTYVNLIKNICKSRNREEIVGNVYKSDNPDPSVKISFSKNKGSNVEHQWTANTHCEDLNDIQIYDSKCIDAYLKNDSEVLYEPAIITQLTFISSFCDDFKKYLLKLKNQKELSKPTPIPDLQSSDIIEKYNSAFSLEKIEEIEQFLIWTENNSDRLVEIDKSLNESDPEKMIAALTSQNDFISEQKSQYLTYYDKIDDECCKNIVELKKNVKTCKDIVEQAAIKVFADLNLEGVGNDTWKALWLAAKNYSVNNAYKDKKFPFIDDGALCVLCHQPIRDDAKKKLLRFEEHVQSNLEQNLIAANESFKEKINELPDIQEWNDFRYRLNSLQFDEELIKSLEEKYNSYVLRIKNLKDLLNEELPCKIPDKDSIILFCDNITKQNNESIETFSNALGDRSILEKEKLNLLARKWMNQSVVNTDLLREIEKINFAIDTTNTTLITNCISRLSEQLITKDFVDRFQKELEYLGAQKIRITLDKKPKKGRVYHKIVLKDSENHRIPAKDVLSEGELRIASFAAFVAEMELSDLTYPFIFDDPTCSLDADYELKIAEKLVDISRKRQVIVFTHRLPMINEIQNYNVDGEMTIIQLRGDKVGAPDPNSYIDFLKPKDVLKKLKTSAEDLKSLLKNNDFLAHDAKLKMLYSSMRITAERCIEKVLLGEIIVRYNKVIHSRLLPNLNCIEPEDIKLLNDLMTKYSNYEHSNPGESTPKPLSDEDIIKDITELDDWIRKYNRKFNEYTAKAIS